MSRSCRQSEFLKHVEALERWADGRERAIAVLEHRAERLARQGSLEEADRLRSAACHLRWVAFEDRALAVRLRRTISVRRDTPPQLDQWQLRPKRANETE